MVLQLKNLLTKQETPEMQFPSLHWEDPLEEEMTTHSSTLAWKLPWTEEPNTVQKVSKSQTQLSDLTHKPADLTVSGQKVKILQVG